MAFPQLARLLPACLPVIQYPLLLLQRDPTNYVLLRLLLLLRRRKLVSRLARAKNLFAVKLGFWVKLSENGCVVSQAVIQKQRKEKNMPSSLIFFTNGRGQDKKKVSLLFSGFQHIKQVGIPRDNQSTIKRTLYYRASTSSLNPSFSSQI